MVIADIELLQGCYFFFYSYVFVLKPDLIARFKDCQNITLQVLRLQCGLISDVLHW